MVSGSASNGRSAISLVSTVYGTTRPAPPIRVDRNTPSLLLTLIAAILLHAVVISAFLVKLPDSVAPIEPPSIAVELVNEEPPPAKEAREVPKPPPQKLRESGGDPELAPGRVPETDRIDPTPNDSRRQAVNDSAPPPAQPRSDPALALELPSRKPAPKTVATPPAKASPQSTATLQQGIGEGGGDRYLNQIRDEIEEQRVYPAIAGPMQLSGYASYELVINRRGDLLRLRLMKSSGVGPLDQEGIGMIQRAAPFPPVPAELPGEFVRLDLVMYLGPRR